jgi:hypothetical protein
MNLQVTHDLQRVKKRREIAAEFASLQAITDRLKLSIAYRVLPIHWCSIKR